MYVYVLDEYQKWGERGYTIPYQCPAHPDTKCLTYANAEGLIVKCVHCFYKRFIGQAEYEEILKSIELAKDLFRMNK